MSRLARVAPGGDIPLAAALTRALSDESVEAVVIGAMGQDVPEGRLLDLLTGGLDVGAVVPKVIGASSDRLLEAGAVGRGGRVTPRGAGDRADLPQYECNCDVLGSAFSFVAAARTITARAVLDLSPTDDDGYRVTQALLAAARADGKRVVYEPGWRVTAGEPEHIDAPRHSLEARTGEPDEPDILMVASFTPGEGPGADRSALRLLDSLRRVCPPSRISVLALDGFGARPHAEALRAGGLELNLAPIDIQGWFEDRWARFSHVFVGQTALRSSLRQHLARTQPQAARILYVDSLPSRDIEAWRTATAPEESPGLEAMAANAVNQTIQLALWATCTWCERSVDARLLAGLVPDRPVVTVPPDLDDPSVRRPGYTGRAGMVVWAAEAHQVSSGNEEAALEVIENVLPRLRRRDPSLGLRMITDSPSPMLERAVSDSGIALVPTSAAAAAMAEARVLLALHGFGTGGQTSVLQAIRHGTPFVVSPQAASGLDLGGVATYGVFGLGEDVVNRVWQLLDSQLHWSRFADALGELRGSTYSGAARAAAIEGVLARVGIAAHRHHERWPVVRPAPSSAPPASRITVPLRPKGFRTAASSVPDGGDDRELYRAWCERYGPTAAALTEFRAELATLAYQPLISVVMPVYNTDPDALRRAIESVRSQVYGRWQLCMADDGSTNPETLTVLDEYADDPAVSIVRLPGNSGISGATNAALALAEGEYVAFLDHDDLYKPHALAQVVRWLNADPSLDFIYSDEDKVDEAQRLIDPHIKPDWSPDHLMSNNYVCHLMVIRRSLVEKVGGLRSAYDGSQDYDLVLRVAEQTDRIAHIPEPLYSWRIIEGSAAADAGAKPYAWRAGKSALEDALRRRGYPGHVSYTANPGIYRSSYALPGRPRVTIIIPTKDRVDLLQPCIESIFGVTTYPNFEVLVIDNGTTDDATLGYLARMPGRVIRYPYRFNYARMMNLAAASAEADALLFLNNDTRVISAEWMEALLEHAMRPEVGAVGGRLYFEDGRVQHEGIFLGVVGLAANAHYNGFWARGDFVRNTSAVTGACMMVRPSVYQMMGGFDERLRMAYNDVDLCLRIRQVGLEVVYTPYASLYHLESASRSYQAAEGDQDGPLFARRWRPRETVDPYYSPMFLRDWPFVIAI